LEYRSFGKLEFRPSALGFGCMRLPKTSQEPPQVDEAEAIRMIRYAIDNGVNYMDTAYNYHQGKSEVVLGKALREGYREKVMVATKMPVFSMKEAAEADLKSSEQLERLSTEYIDFYLLHSMDDESWPRAKEFGLLPWAEKQIAEGRIRHFGFSFHDGAKLFKEIVDYYPWDFCQVQYNYLDVNWQAGLEGVKYAAGKGLGVIVMEPLRGGVLATVPNQRVQALWDSALVKRTPADWALKWLWDQPEVSLVLSGMSTMDQVIENVASAGKSAIGSLTSSEASLVEKVAEEYRSLMALPCTACGYCSPCPEGVSVPTLFSMYNEALGFTPDPARLAGYQKYYAGIPRDKQADACVHCGSCEKRCPQHLPIRDLLPKVHETLGSSSLPQK